MYLEEVYCSTYISSDTTQLNNYLHLIGEIKGTSFEIALEKYLRVSRGDTNIDKFSDEMLERAQDKARKQMLKFIN